MKSYQGYQQAIIINIKSFLKKERNIFLYE